MKLYNERKRLHRYLDPVQESPSEKKLDDLLNFAEHYLNLTTLQMERLELFEEMTSTINGEITEKDDIKALTLYFGDIQFFFNCAHKFLIFTQRLYTLLSTKPPANFIDLEVHYRTIRNHFEHIDERIERHPLYSMNFSTVSENGITINGMDYDISVESLLPLYTVYENVTEVIDTLVKPRRGQVDRFIEGLEHHMKLSSKDFDE